MWRPDMTDDSSFLDDALRDAQEQLDRFAATVASAVATIGAGIEAFGAELAAAIDAEHPA